MFTELAQYYWIKVEVARGGRTQECFEGVREACSDAALPYRTVVRWVKALREDQDRDAVQDNFHTGRPHVENNTLQLIASLLDADHRWTARELAAEVGLC